MHLDRQLREASTELQAAVARRRGLPIDELADRHRRTRRRIGFTLSLVLLVGALVGTVIVSRRDGGNPSVAAVAPDGTSGPSATTPVTEAPTTTATSTSPGPGPTADQTGGGDGLSGMALLPSGWLDGFPGEVIPLLAEEGIGVAAVEETDPQIGSWALAEVTNERVDQSFQFEVADTAAIHVDSEAPSNDPGGAEDRALATSDGGDNGLPAASLGFAIDFEDQTVLLYGVAPAGTTQVRVHLSDSPPIVIERVYERPRVSRTAFIHSIDLATLEADIPTWPELSISVDDVDSSQLPLTLQLHNPGRHPNGLAVEDLFAQPLGALIAATMNVDQLPSVVTCQAGPGTEPPPNQGGLAADAGTHATPQEALEVFLSAGVGDPPIAATGYTELVSPDGSVSYAIGLDGDIDNGVVTLISVVPAADGWTVDRWEGSGC